MKSPFLAGVLFLLIFAWSDRCVGQYYFTLTDLYHLVQLTNVYDIKNIANNYGYFSDDLQGTYKDKFGNQLSFGLAYEKAYMFYKIKLSPGVVAKIEKDMYDECYFTLNGKDAKTKYYSSWNSRFQISSIREMDYWELSVSESTKSDFNIARIVGPNIIKVSSYSNYTGIQLKKGDKLTLTVTGEVTLGPFAGKTGPEGIDGYTMYNYVQGFKQGSLLGKIGNSAWFLVGNDKTITCGQGGDLQLIVNDNDPSNNSGYFDVKYYIKK